MFARVLGSSIKSYAQIPEETTFLTTDGVLGLLEFDLVNSVSSSGLSWSGTIVLVLAKMLARKCTYVLFIRR